MNNFTFDKYVLLEDKEIDIIIELEVTYKSEDYNYLIGTVNLLDHINNKELENPDVFIGLLSVV